MINSRNLTDAPDLLKAQEAAHLLGSNVDTICQMCKRGDLPAVKIGRRWFISKAKLLEKMGVDA